MSRIHEALKKAELERSAQSIPERPPFDPQVAAEADRSGAAQGTSIATDVLIQPDTVRLVAGGPLRFEELRSRCATPPWHPNPSMNVFSNPETTGDAAEQFRTLRSRLYQVQSTQHLRIILVTSPMVGDGKTFVASNLAQAIIRQTDRRVLIIDGDMRASRLDIHLGAPKAPGLTDYLRGDVDEMAVIQCGQESSLFLIPGGNAVANPSELLANGRLKTLLDRIAPLFDWVILDSPPCVPVADARVLADLCDGVLLVVRAGSTSLASAQRATQELQGKNVVGVVLNSVQENDFEYSSYYGSAYDGRTPAKKSNKLKKV